MSASTRGSLSAPGGVVLDLSNGNTWDNRFDSCISAGTWTGLTAQMEGSSDLGSTWTVLGAAVNPPDGAQFNFSRDRTGFNKVRVHVTALGSGTVVIQLESWMGPCVTKPFVETRYG